MVSSHGPTEAISESGYKLFGPSYLRFKIINNSNNSNYSGNIMYILRCFNTPYSMLLNKWLPIKYYAAISFPI